MNSLLGNWLTSAPIWGIGLALFVAMLAAAWIGSWLRRRYDHGATSDGKSDEKKDKGETQEGLVISSVMALLALLVGFTFSLSLDRFDARRTGVLQEANAIGTTYLRTQLLEPSDRTRISGLLVDYTDNRLALAQEQPGARLDTLLARNNQLITELWKATVTAFPSIKGYDFSSSYLETMNEMIDMDATRQTARRAHVPPEVFLLLFVYQLVAAGVFGYVLIGKRGRRASIFLFLLFGLSILLVIDLDRPTSGGVRISQQPMLDLREMMRADPPAVFGGFDAPPPAPRKP